MTTSNDQSADSAGQGDKNPAVLVFLAITAGAVMVAFGVVIVGFLGIVTPSIGLPSMPLRIAGLVLMVSGLLVTILICIKLAEQILWDRLKQIILLRQIHFKMVYYILFVLRQVHH